MSFRQRGTSLHQKTGCARRIELLFALHHVLQGFARDVLQLDEMKRIGLTDIVYGHDVRMDHGRCGAGFRDEHIKKTVIATPQLGRQHLDGTRAVQRIVPGQENPSHAAFAQERFDRVRSELPAHQMAADVGGDRAIIFYGPRRCLGQVQRRRFVACRHLLPALRTPGIIVRRRKLLVTSSAVQNGCRHDVALHALKRLLTRTTPMIAVFESGNRLLRDL